jgi:hypothetical protein
LTLKILVVWYGAPLKGVGMKKFFTKCLEFGIGLPLVLLALALPFLAPLFGISLAGALLAGYGFGYEPAREYVEYVWLLYPVIAMFSFLLFSTFTYQECCIGFNTPQEHMRHHGRNFLSEELPAALMWPWTWFTFNHNLWHMFGLTFADALSGAIRFWVIDYWRGSKFTIVDLQSGDVTETRVKNPEEFKDSIRSMIDDTEPKK